MTRSAINYKECTLPDFVIYGTVPSKTKNSVHASNTASQSKDISRNSLPVSLKIHIVSNKSHYQQQRFGGWRASQFLYACASEPGETGTSKGKPPCWDFLHAHPSSVETSREPGLCPTYQLSHRLFPLHSFCISCYMPPGNSNTSVPILEKSMGTLILTEKCTKRHLMAQFLQFQQVCEVLKQHCNP